MEEDAASGARVRCPRGCSMKLAIRPEQDNSLAALSVFLMLSCCMLPGLSRFRSHEPYRQSHEISSSSSPWSSTASLGS
jgi:hypothetical protein